MAMNTPVEELITRLGHDGGAIIFPDNPEPSDRAGHSIYELVALAVDLGFAVTPLPLMIGHASARDPSEIVPIWSEDEAWRRFTRHLLMSSGTIACNGPRWNHMVAYDQGLILNPDGEEFIFSRQAFEQRNLFPVCLWRIDKL